MWINSLHPAAAYSREDVVQTLYAELFEQRRADPLPLRTDRDGVIRVGGTRVTLDTVIGAFQQGADAGEIAVRRSREAR